MFLTIISYTPQSINRLFTYLYGLQKHFYYCFYKNKNYNNDDDCNTTYKKSRRKNEFARTNFRDCANFNDFREFYFIDLEPKSLK